MSKEIVKQDAPNYAEIIRKRYLTHNCKYVSPKDLQRAVDNYFLYLVDNPDIVADIPHFACTVFGNMSSYRSYLANELFRDIVESAKDQILAIKMQMGFKNKINSTLLIFDLKNTHGYTDRVEQKTDQNITVTIDPSLTEYSK